MGKGQRALDIRKCWQMAPETFGMGVGGAGAPAKASVSSMEREPRLTVESGGIWGTGLGGLRQNSCGKVGKGKSLGTT